MVVKVPLNKRIQTHAEIMGRHGEGERWAEQLIDDGRNRGVWISGPPGTPPDPHIHPDFNEWWIALDGSTEWQIGQYEPVHSAWGDVIMAPAGYCHIIEPKQGVQAIRFGITHPDSNHDIKGIKPCRYVPVDAGQSSPNLIHTKLQDVVARIGDNSNWVELIVSDERNYSTYIHELPGTFNQPDVHADENRWWVVVQGKVEWDIAGQDIYTTGPGDVVFVDAGVSYSTKTVGNEPSIRISVEAPKS